MFKNAVSLFLVILIWTVLFASMQHDVSNPIDKSLLTTRTESGSLDNHTTVFFSSGLQAVASKKESLRDVAGTSKRRGLMGKKKKKRRPSDDPAKALKLAATPAPTVAPIHRPTNIPYSSVGADLDLRPSGSDSSVRSTSSPGVILSRERESASERHENGKRGKGDSSGKGKKGKGKKNMKKEKTSSSSKSSGRDQQAPPSSPSPVPTLQYPTAAPEEQTMPPYPDILDIPSLFRPPTNPPTFTLAPNEDAATTDRPVGFVPIPPDRNNDRPTPPLIVLTPVALLTPIPTTRINTPSPSKGFIALISPSDLPSPAPTKSSLGLTFLPTGTATNTSPPTEMSSDMLDDNSVQSNATTTGLFDFTARPSSTNTSMMQPTQTPTLLTTALPTSVPTPDNGIRRIAIPRTYIAYMAPDTERPPTAPETLFVVQLTTLYFEEIFAALYRDSDFSFERVELDLISNLYDKAMPEERFNIYLEVDTSFIFQIVNDTVELPQVSDIFSQMIAAIDTKYIMDYVWQVPRDSPFFKTQEVVTGAVAVARPSTDETEPRAKEQNLTASNTTSNFTLSESVKQLEDRFILPGSRLPAGLFRLNEALEEDADN